MERGIHRVRIETHLARQEVQSRPTSNSALENSSPDHESLSQSNRHGRDPTLDTAFTKEARAMPRVRMRHGQPHRKYLSHKFDALNSKFGMRDTTRNAGHY